MYGYRHDEDLNLLALWPCLIVLPAKKPSLPQRLPGLIAISKWGQMGKRAVFDVGFCAINRCRAARKSLKLS